MLASLQKPVKLIDLSLSLIQIFRKKTCLIQAETVNRDLLATPNSSSVLMRQRWLIVLAAALLTSGTLLLMPLTSQMQPPQRSKLEMVQARTKLLPEPEPPVQETTVPKPQPEPQPETPLPEPPPINPAPEEPTPSVTATDLAVEVTIDMPKVSFEPQLDFKTVTSTSRQPTPETGTSGEPTGIYGLAQLDVAPSPLNQMRPAYPFVARSRGIEGSVKVQFIVTPEGTVRRVNVLDAHPPGTFEDAARRAVQKWRFKPGQKNGHPVAVQMELNIKFQLEK